MNSSTNQYRDFSQLAISTNSHKSVGPTFSVLPLFSKQRLSTKFSVLSTSTKLTLGYFLSPQLFTGSRAQYINTQRINQANFLTVLAHSYRPTLNRITVYIPNFSIHESNASQLVDKQISESAHHVVSDADIQNIHNDWEKAKKLPPQGDLNRLRTPRSCEDRSLHYPCQNLLEHEPYSIPRDRCCTPGNFWFLEHERFKVLFILYLTH